MREETRREQAFGDALTDDDLTQVLGGVQKVREALTDDELTQVVGGSIDPNDPVGTVAGGGVDPDAKATPILF